MVVLGRGWETQVVTPANNLGLRKRIGMCRGSMREVMIYNLNVSRWWGVIQNKGLAEVPWRKNRRGGDVKTMQDPLMGCTCTQFGSNYKGGGGEDGHIRARPPAVTGAGGNHPPPPAL